MVYVKSKETNGELLEIGRDFIQIYLHLATKSYCFLVFTLVYKLEGLCPLSLLIHNPVRLLQRRLPDFSGHLEKDLVKEWIKNK